MSDLPFLFTDAKGLPEISCTQDQQQLRGTLQTSPKNHILDQKEYAKRGKAFPFMFFQQQCRILADAAFLSSHSWQAAPAKVIQKVQDVFCNIIIYHCSSLGDTVTMNTQEEFLSIKNVPKDESTQWEKCGCILCEVSPTKEEISNLFCLQFVKIPLLWLPRFAGGIRYFHMMQKVTLSSFREHAKLLLGCISFVCILSTFCDFFLFKRHQKPSFFHSNSPQNRFLYAVFFNNAFLYITFPPLHFLHKLFLNTVSELQIAL